MIWRKFHTIAMLVRCWFCAQILSLCCARPFISNHNICLNSDACDGDWIFCSHILCPSTYMSWYCYKASFKRPKPVDHFEYMNIFLFFCLHFPNNIIISPKTTWTRNVKVKEKMEKEIQTKMRMGSSKRRSATDAKRKRENAKSRKQNNIEIEMKPSRIEIKKTCEGWKDSGGYSCRKGKTI